MGLQLESLALARQIEHAVLMERARREQRWGLTEEVLGQLCGRPGALRRGLARLLARGAAWLDGATWTQNGPATVGHRS